MALPETAHAFHARVASLSGASPALSTAAFVWSHQALFVGLDARAGQIRDQARERDGTAFARPDLIIASLDDRFAALSAALGFRGFGRDEFIAALAHHVSELNVIQPFVTGNRRVIALHAEQLARAAGYAISLAAVAREEWDAALDESFLFETLDRLIAIFSGEVWSGGAGDTPGGIAAFPEREAPLGRRYLKNLAAAKRELGDIIDQARDEASARLTAMIAHAAPTADIDWATRELAFLEHQHGPLFQANLASIAGTEAIEAVFSKTQTPLERVREISAGLVIAINRMPRTLVEQASRNLRKPVYPPGGSPHQDRLAAKFLTNSARLNLADPRFAVAQRRVETLSAATVGLHGFDRVRTEQLMKAAQLAVAERIRCGDMAGVKAQLLPETLSDARRLMTPPPGTNDLATG